MSIPANDAALMLKINFRFYKMYIIYLSVFDVNYHSSRVKCQYQNYKELLFTKLGTRLEVWSTPWESDILTKVS